MTLERSGLALARCATMIAVPKSTDAVLWGTMLRSKNPALIEQAIQQLAPIVTRHAGNLLKISEEKDDAGNPTGIKHRTLCRWLKDSPEFAALVASARNSASSS